MFGNTLVLAGNWLVYVFVRVFLAVIQTLSADRGDRIARAGGWLLARLPLRKKVIDRNLQLVFKRLSSSEQRGYRERMWHHLLLMVCELAWAPRRVHRTNWKKHCQFSNKAGMLGPMLGSKPCVTVTGHFGNFEFAGYLTGLFGLKTMTIARPLDNPFLDRFLATFRGAKGQIMVPKEGSAPIVNAHLKEGKSLVLLADQHAGDKGCWVDFLGVPASCHKSLALFTLTAGAPLVVIANRRCERPLQFVLDYMGTASAEAGGEEVSGVRELTMWYNRRLAEAISRAPEQYWWLHRRWRTPPLRVVQRAEANREEARQVA